MEANIVIQEDETFGNANYRVVRALLYMVDANMMTALERPRFSTKKCVVIHTEDVPMCAKMNEQHLILLSTKNNRWCQWVYQFAHEYCHHLIDGTLSGEWSNLLWFEETICELSSIYNLGKMIGFCDSNGLQSYAPHVKEYHENLLTKNKDSFHLGIEGGWYSEYKTLLSEKEYFRDLYNAMAVQMYPFFLDNPHLWKIIQHIGNIRMWNSLEDLFVHLDENADKSYKTSLKKLKTMFS